MAAARRGRLCRRAPSRADTARNAGGARTIEPISLQPRVQTIVWGSATSLSHKSPYRARQGPVGGSGPLGDGYRTELGLQRDELVHNDLPEVDRCDSAPLPQKPGMKRGKVPAFTRAGFSRARSLVTYRSSRS